MVNYSWSQYWLNKYNVMIIANDTNIYTNPQTICTLNVLWFSEWRNIILTTLMLICRLSKSQLNETNDGRTISNDVMNISNYPWSIRRSNYPKYKFILIYKHRIHNWHRKYSNELIQLHPEIKKIYLLILTCDLVSPIPFEENMKIHRVDIYALTSNYLKNK